MHTQISNIRVLVLVLLAAAALFTGGHAAAASASAVTVDLVVNAGGDLNFGACDATHCTFREAVTSANASVGVRETIKFDLPSGTCFGGACVITLNSPLPDLTDPVVIDGYTQDGASPNTLAIGNNAQLRVILKASGGMNGLVVTDGNSEIRGLVLQNFVVAVHLNSDDNLVAGNFIGTNRTGTGVGVKNVIGVYVDGTENRVGGSTATDRNLISGNDVGVALAGTHMLIQGNYIGTDANGTAAVPNKDGIRGLDGHSARIGGKGKLARNVIAGNEHIGIDAPNTVQAYTIERNLIGVGANGKAALGNEVGINIGGLSSNHVISGNKIRNQAFEGIRIFDSGAPATNAVITRNSIYQNGALGIDLGYDGVTANDSGDADTGPNNFVNYPSIQRAYPGAGKTKFKGRIEAKPNTTYRIELYASPTCNDVPGADYGEGKKYLGTVDVTTDATGRAKIRYVKYKDLMGQLVTATATEMDGEYPAVTSEFSRCRLITLS